MLGLGDKRTCTSTTCSILSVNEWLKDTRVDHIKLGIITETEIKTNPLRR